MSVLNNLFVWNWMNPFLSWVLCVSFFLFFLFSIEVSFLHKFLSRLLVPQLRKPRDGWKRFFMPGNRYVKITVSFPVVNVNYLFSILLVLNCYTTRPAFYRTFAYGASDFDQSLWYEIYGPCSVTMRNMNFFFDIIILRNNEYFIEIKERDTNLGIIGCLSSTWSSMRCSMNNLTAWFFVLNS